MGGVAGILGLGLIGVGAHAAFTTSTTSKQTITAGTLDVVLHATPGLVTGSNTQAVLTLKSAPAEGSTFSTGTVKITVKNAGNVPVSEIKFTPGDTYNASTSKDSAFATAANICVTSTTYVLFNGPLHTFLSGQIVTGTIQPFASTPYVVNVYAGTVHTACGSATGGETAPAGGGTSTSPALTNTAQGGVIQPSITVTETG